MIKGRFYLNKLLKKNLLLKNVEITATHLLCRLLMNRLKQSNRLKSDRSRPASGFCRNFDQ